MRVRSLCLLAASFLRLAAATAEARPAWLVSNGFHSAIALRVADLGPEPRATVGDPAARWVVLSWGEKHFFFTRKRTVGAFIQAVGWPTPSALHVVPLRQPPEQALTRSDLVRFEISEPAFVRMRRHLAGQFAHDTRGRLIPLGPGLFAGSAFYLGAESFYFPKMCNWWTARALETGGVRFAKIGALAAPWLVWQAEGSGARIGRRSRPADAF